MNKIHCYSESLDKNMKWQADNRHTFEMATAVGNDPWPEMLPTYDDFNPSLNGLLLMGANRNSPPFAFAARKFPSKASIEVKRLYTEEHSGDKYLASYLTRAELESKTAELLIINNDKALAVRPHLIDLIKKLPKTSVEEKNQRIVFWFT
jgi:hypothetical protein